MKNMSVSSKDALAGAGIGDTSRCKHSNGKSSGWYNAFSSTETRDEEG